MSRESLEKAVIIVIWAAVTAVLAYLVFIVMDIQLSGNLGV